MIDHRYRCDLCDDWCEPHWTRGFYETEMHIGVVVMDPRDCEKHICRDCMKAIADDLRDLKKAERLARKAA